MIRGYFDGSSGRRRPYIVGKVSIASSGVKRDIHFLVDTGADVTLLSPRDAAALRLDLRSFPRGRSTGVGGDTATAHVPAEIMLDSRTIGVVLRILMPSQPARREAEQTIPSLLGRDVLAHFGLYIEERRDLILLLEPAEVERLNLP